MVFKSFITLVSLVTVVTSVTAAPFFHIEQVPTSNLTRRDASSFPALPGMTAVCQETEGCVVQGDGSLQFSATRNVQVSNFASGISSSGSDGETSVQTSFGLDNAMITTGLCNTVDLLEATLDQACSPYDNICLGTWQASCQYKDQRRTGGTDPDVGKCSMTVDMEYPNDPSNTFQAFKALGKQLMQSLFDDANSGAQVQIQNPTSDGTLTSYSAPTRMHIVNQFKLNSDDQWKDVGHLYVGITCDKPPPPSNLACEILKGIFGGLLDLVTAGVGSQVTKVLGQVVLAGAGNAAGQGVDNLC